jgi:hypothetical protein
LQQYFKILIKKYNILPAEQRNTSQYAACWTSTQSHSVATQEFPGTVLFVISNAMYTVKLEYYMERLDHVISILYCVEPDFEPTTSFTAG